MTSAERKALQAHLDRSKAQLGEAKAELPKLARTSLAGYHQAILLVRDAEVELAAIEDQLRRQRDLGGARPLPPISGPITRAHARPKATRSLRTSKP